MSKDNIPILSPDLCMSITYNKKTGKITDIEVNWGELLRSPKVVRIDHIRWLLEEVEKDPIERKREMKEAENRANLRVNNIRREEWEGN